MFIRKKKIDGKTYHYLVKSVRATASPCRKCWLTWACMTAGILNNVTRTCCSGKSSEAKGTKDMTSEKRGRGTVALTTSAEARSGGWRFTNTANRYA